MDRLVVMGASSGGIEALSQLIGSLPASFGAPVCVVSHTSPESPAVLDQILARAGRLSTSMAQTGDRFRPGHVHVAPPDHHLLVEPGVLRLSRGPKENRFRPAIDVLFRSAAQVYGPRVIGVILTGSLDDGAAGLWAIRQLGGIPVVQAPEGAAYPAMPTHALRRVPDAHVAHLPEMGALLERLLTTSVHEEAPLPQRHLDVEVRIAKNEPPIEAGVLGLGAPSSYTCPECHGNLMTVEEGGRVRYRCHTGHAYSIASLLADLSASIDDTLGGAERVLQEHALLLRRLADDGDAEVDQGRIAALRAQAEESARQAQVVRNLLSDRGRLPRERTA